MPSAASFRFSRGKAPASLSTSASARTKPRLRARASARPRDSHGSASRAIASPPKGTTPAPAHRFRRADRKSTRLNSSHVKISYAVFCFSRLPPIPPLFPYTTLFRSVIQIFTRQSSGFAFDVGVGSNETSTASASFGATSGQSWFSIAGNRIATEGYNSCAGAPFPPGGGCFTNEPDRDGYENSSVTLRYGLRWQRS